MKGQEMREKGLCALGAAVLAACALADVDWPSTFASDVAANAAMHAATAATGTGTLAAAFDSLAGGLDAFDLTLSAMTPFDTRSRTWAETAGILLDGTKPRGTIISFR